MGQALGDPLLHDVGQQGMGAERSGHQVADPGMAGGGLGGQGGDVAVPVRPGQRK